MTVNQMTKVDTYLLPRIENLLASLNGGMKFSKLDLTHAYQQALLTEDFKGIVTINTHKNTIGYLLESLLLHPSFNA